MSVSHRVLLLSRGLVILTCMWKFFSYTVCCIKKEMNVVKLREEEK